MYVVIIMITGFKLCADFNFLEGDLSLHYLRWLNTLRNNGNEVTLEIAFWIGPQVVETPSQSLRARYSDTADTEYADRWIIFHLHIDVDRDTFLPDHPAYYVGATGTTVYHSQTYTFPRAVTDGIRADYRAEYWYTNNYRGGRNHGNLQNYNSRTPAIECPRFRGRWYVGHQIDVNSGLPELMMEFVCFPNIFLSVYTKANLSQVDLAPRPGCFFGERTPSTVAAFASRWWYMVNDDI
jgi:hypothetical protein